MSSPGDVVGVESCIDLRSNDDTTIAFYTGAAAGHRSFTPAKMTMKKKQMREYPPPLPSLAWEMKRYRTCDGRLIIREEKAGRLRHHDVFRADRSNGRLTLHLLHSDSDHHHEEEEGVFQMDMGDDDVSSIRSFDEYEKANSSSTCLHYCE
uniref:FAF domain-containing protein n=1 Tax=Kalanchoe fedtschenkoi TaxID=63787 RepID=A0A7N0UXR7_KALFE